MELSEPVGLLASCKLRTYQKQSLAFMVNRERGTNDPDWKSFTVRRLFVIPGFSRRMTLEFPNAKVGLLCDEVGMGKSLVCIALVLANPFQGKRMSDSLWSEARAGMPALTGLVAVDHATVGTRPFLKESGVPTSRWTNEFGNPLSWYQIMHIPGIRAAHTKWKIAYDKNELFINQQHAVNNKIMKRRHSEFSVLLNSNKFKVKTTVISTTVTLLGQWYDEIRKFAPHLTVKVFHSSFNKRESKISATADLRDVDILLSVSTTKLPVQWRLLSFQRLIADEVHAYKFPLNAHSTKMWGVTATPFAKFKKICDEFYHTRKGGSASLAPLANLWSSMPKHTDDANQKRCADILNTWMIRHTKDQTIAGAAALKLPPMPASTILVKMTSSEMKEYLSQRNKNLDVAMALGMRSFPHVSDKIGKSASAGSLDLKLHPIRSATNVPSKMKALEKDVQTMLKSQPSANILIFTRFAESINTLKKFAASSPTLSKMQWYQISGSVSPSVRQNSIREFQNEKNKSSKLLVVSYNTGQCGITLTAASRVYLLEPCLLPSDEVQAGGRISRLGQTKKISLVRLVAKDTVDEGIIEYHQKIASGATTLTEDGKFRSSVYPALLTKGSAQPPATQKVAWRMGSTWNGSYTASSYVWHSLYQKILNNPGLSLNDIFKRTQRQLMAALARD